MHVHTHHRNVHDTSGGGEIQQILSHRGVQPKKIVLDLVGSARRHNRYMHSAPSTKTHTLLVVPMLFTVVPNVIFPFINHSGVWQCEGISHIVAQVQWSCTQITLKYTQYTILLVWCHASVQTTGSKVKFYPKRQQ